MHYASDDATEMMGIGNYVGEIRESADGHLYEWNQGVDGLGNPVGFWKLIKKGIRAALPLASKIPGIGPHVATAGRLAKQAGLLGAPHGIGDYVGEVQEGSDGQLYEWAQGVDGLGNPVGFWKLIKKGLRAALPLASKIPGIGPHVATAGRLARQAGLLGDPGGMGIGNYVGEVREGPDGGLYEWNEGVDGLGNPVGFWKLIKKGARAAGRWLKKGGLKKIANFALPIASMIPGVGPAIATAGGVLKATGLLGVEGPIMEAPDGSHYEMVHGIGEYGETRTRVRPVRLVIPAEMQGGGRVMPVRRAAG